jgi:hypothetical protein
VKALVVGNGESRKQIDLNLFKRDEWEIYGCNALYREFIPDHLIILDSPMREEFEQSGVKVANVHYIEDIPEYEPMMNSGAMALAIAMRTHSEIHLIGFDLEDSDGRVNNIYNDTENYYSSNKESGGFIIEQYNIKVMCNRYRGKGKVVRVADNNPFELDKYLENVKIKEYIKGLENA